MQASTLFAGKAKKNFLCALEEGSFISPKIAHN
jgi:hypothetical protein